MCARLLLLLCLLISRALAAAEAVKPFRLELSAGFPSSGLSAEYVFPWHPLRRSIGVSSIIGYFPFPLYSENEDTPQDPYAHPSGSKVENIFVTGLRCNLYQHPAGCGVFLSPVWNFLSADIRTQEYHYVGGSLEKLTREQTAAANFFSLRTGYRLVRGPLTLSAEIGYGAWMTRGKSMPVVWSISDKHKTRSRRCERSFGYDVTGAVTAGAAF